MSEKKSGQQKEATVDEGQRSLKRAIIIFAIIEALVLVPVTIYLILR